MKSKLSIFISISLSLFIALSFNQARPENSPFLNMPEEVRENLYYFLSVVDYTVAKANPDQDKEQNQATITLKLTSNQASVMTDRPYRKTTYTPLENIIKYLNKEKKKDLNLTLMIHGKDDVYTPLSFEQRSVSYNSRDNTITFQAILVDSTAVKQWAKRPEERSLQGKYTTLMAEG